MPTDPYYLTTSSLVLHDYMHHLLQAQPKPSILFCLYLNYFLRDSKQDLELEPI